MWQSETGAGPISRRQLLQGTAVGLIGASFGKGLTSRALFAQEIPSLKGLIVRSAEPRNAEPSLGRLIERWVTPTESFYVRTHGNTPTIDPKEYRLTVEGLVEKPLTISLGELIERFPATSVTATLTCAGNRRSEMSALKKVGGVQWDAGAIGNAEWRGVRLADVLKLVGVKPEAKHVWFDGLDKITEKGETFAFGGSIPLEKAVAGSPVGSSKEQVPSLLATHMNGQPLTADHGFPVRSLVPGYIGARSVKWLGKITVSDRPSPNHYVADAYKLIAEDSRAALDAASPLYEFAFNSVICSPSATDADIRDLVKVKGFALPKGAHGSSIKKIEVSIDKGRSWLTASVVSPVREHCWVLWEAAVPLGLDTKELHVRATDSSGEVQPETGAWNFKGYQYNGWHKVVLKRG